MTAANKELVFVYNAAGDLFSQVTDFAHKVLAPESYQCALCKLTYGNFAMKSRWRDFLKSVPYPKSFFHRDDFLRRFPQGKDTALPAILALADGRLRPVITADQLRDFSDLDELITKLQEKLPTL